MYAIKTIGLTKKYDSITAVDGLDLEIGRGELFALLGVNGAGKSTAIKMLSCLTRPTSGDALIEGHSILTDEQDVKRIIAVSPQETAVAPNLTVRENLDLILGVHGFSAERRRTKIDGLTEQFGLSDVLERRAGKLSGGWSRRLSIAMALASEPRVLFLDEPTLGLDVISRAELWELIRSLSGKVTILLTTHYMEEAEVLSDRIGIMKDGQMLAVGTAEELMASTGESRLEGAFISIVRRCEG